MASRRSLTTAAAAGAALFALCSVPSASAAPVTSAQTPAAVPAAAPATVPDAVPAPSGLADTGAMDTTPYLVGGIGFLGVGAALLLAARRRALLPD